MHPEHSTPNPIILGPLLIHYSKTEEVYTTFFRTLVRLRPGISLLKANGTDGETALCNALVKTFCQAIPLRCFKHVETNIKMKLSDLGLSRSERRFMEDIMHGENALLDYETCVSFDNLLLELEKTWSVIDTSGKFIDYIKALAPMMKISMIASVRTRAKLGCPPDSESNNFRIKNWMGFHEKSIPNFVKEIKSFITGKQMEMQKCFCNLLQCTEFLKFSAHRKNSFLKRVASVSMSDLLNFSKIPNDVNSALAESCIVTVHYKNAGISVAISTLKNIWSAAAQLIQNADKAIFPARCLTDGILKYTALRSMTSGQDTHIVT